MPLLTFRCVQCLALFETLVGDSSAAPRCELCEGFGVRHWGGVPHGGQLKGPDYDNDLRDPLAMQMAMDNRKWLEQNEHLRDSGYITVKENGPAFTRPHGNERPRKFY